MFATATMGYECSAEDFINLWETNMKKIICTALALSLIGSFALVDDSYARGGRGGGAKVTKPRGGGPVNKLVATKVGLSNVQIKKISAKDAAKFRAAGWNVAPNPYSFRQGFVKGKRGTLRRNGRHGVN